MTVGVIDTFSYFRMTTLIMALLTFRAADIFYRNTIHFTRLQVFMELFVNAIEFIPISLAIRKIHFRSPVTVDAPAHTKRRKLLYLVHLGDISMTGLALYLARTDMLGMVEVNMVRQVVNFHPFNLLSGLVVFPGCGIITGIAV